MTGKALIPLLVVLTQVVTGQHSPNSLQEAIEALHRHHEILSSQQHGRRQEFHHSPMADYMSEGPEYAEAAEMQQAQLDRALAEYLSREEERIPARYADSDFDEDNDGDDSGFEARKRSIFRERGGMYVVSSLPLSSGF